MHADEERNRQDETRDTADRWLDGALSSYANAEPPAGMEERVLRRLATERERRAWWWRWAPVPAAVAVVLLLVLHTGTDRSRQTGTGESGSGLAGTAGDAPQTKSPATDSAQRSQAAVSSSGAEAENAPRTTSRRGATAGRQGALQPSRARQDELPRRAQFPTAARATAAERLLAHYAAHEPELLASAMGTPRDREVTEIEFKPLEIEPLNGEERSME